MTVLDQLYKQSELKVPLEDFDNWEYYHVAKLFKHDSNVSKVIKLNEISGSELLGYTKKDIVDKFALDVPSLDIFINIHTLLYNKVHPNYQTNSKNNACFDNKSSKNKSDFDFTITKPVSNVDLMNFDDESFDRDNNTTHIVEGNPNSDVSNLFEEINPPICQFPQSDIDHTNRQTPRSDNNSIKTSSVTKSSIATEEIDSNLMQNRSKKVVESNSIKHFTKPSTINSDKGDKLPTINDANDFNTNNKKALHQIKKVNKGIASESAAQSVNDKRETKKNGKLGVHVTQVKNSFVNNKKKISNSNTFKTSKPVSNLGIPCLSYTGPREGNIIHDIQFASISYQKGKTYFDFIPWPTNKCKITHLIVSKLQSKPTLKILYALANNSYILTPDYVYYAIENGTWPVEEDYEHVKWSMLRDRKKIKSPFKGLKFYLVSNLKKINISDATVIIEKLGGKLVKTSDESTHILSGEENHYKECAKPFRKIIFEQDFIDTISSWNSEQFQKLLQLRDFDCESDDEVTIVEEKIQKRGSDKVINDDTVNGAVNDDKVNGAVNDDQMDKLNKGRDKKFKKLRKMSLVKPCDNSIFSDDNKIFYDTPLYSDEELVHLTDGGLDMF